MVLVTNLEYPLDGYLKNNLKVIPNFLKDGYDCVIVVSGHGKVRIGKSTIAMQIGYFIAWLLAGGEKKRNIKVPFDNSNVVFTPNDLMKKAESLPKGSVILYDEGRAGLDSIRAMERINKGMIDFFQECGQYGHVILIVLPNFHKLTEDIAVSRSLFLVDVFHNEKYKRGYFKFYNERQKEYLYVFGKKRLGTYAKYNAANCSFFGKFGRATPGIDVELYEEQKRKALKEKITLRAKDLKFITQRNRLITLLESKGVLHHQIARAIGFSKEGIRQICVAERIKADQRMEREEKELKEDEEELKLSQKPPRKVEKSSKKSIKPRINKYN